MECDVCKKKDNVNLKLFSCDGCSKHICIKCSNLTSSEVKVLELKTGRILRFHCHKCRQFDTFNLLHKTIEDKMAIITSKEEIISLLRQKIEDLEKANDKNLKIPLYSQILQNKPTISSESLHLNSIPSLIITPKNKQNADITKSDLQQNIKPADLKVGIKNTRITKNGGIIVKCHNRNDVETLRKEAVNKLKDYEVKITKMRQPRFKITGYQGELDVEEIEACIRDQNQVVEENDELKVTFIKHNRKSNTHTIYGECSPLLFHKLLNIKKVFVQWMRYPIYEDITIQRCFKCQEHYHKDTQCANKTVCEHCAEEHNVRECPKLHKKCNNCSKANIKYNLNYNVNHEASDPECPSYQYLIKVLRGKIDYGGYNGY